NGLQAIALNYRLTQGSKLLRQAGLAQLHALALPPHTARRREQSLELLAGLTTQIRELDDAITTAALGHPDAPRLITPPGCGPPEGAAPRGRVGPGAPLPRQQARGQLRRPAPRPARLRREVSPRPH